MFDRNERLVVCNRRYMDLYQLPDEVVKPGRTLASLLEFRVANGSFSRDPEEYRQGLIAAMAQGKTITAEVKSASGRVVAVINRPMVDGGWVATHEDITERRDAERERASMQEQHQRRSIIEQAIAAFRQRVEDHLRTVTDGAMAMRSTASTLLASSGQTSQRAESAVSASNEASSNVETAAAAADELSSSIGEISRQLAKTTDIVCAAVSEAQGTNAQITALSQAAQKIGDVVKLIRTIAGQTNLLALNATIEAARAGEASIVALSASRLVWPAMVRISLTTSPIFCAACDSVVICALAPCASLTAARTISVVRASLRLTSPIELLNSSAATAAVSTLLLASLDADTALSARCEVWPELASSVLAVERMAIAPSVTVRR